MSAYIIKYSVFKGTKLVIKFMRLMLYRSIGIVLSWGSIGIVLSWGSIGIVLPWGSQIQPFKILPIVPSIQHLENPSMPQTAAPCSSAIGPPPARATGPLSYTLLYTFSCLLPEINRACWCSRLMVYNYYDEGITMLAQYYMYSILTVYSWPGLATPINS